MSRFNGRFSNHSAHAALWSAAREHVVQLASVMTIGKTPMLKKLLPIKGAGTRL
jgi:hypothetical protein